MGRRRLMSKVIRTSISFDYYPEEDELMSEMTEEEQMTYCREMMVDDIYSFVKYNEVFEAVSVEVVNEQEA
jgi:hypothetical protein